MQQHFRQQVSQEAHLPDLFRATCAQSKQHLKQDRQWCEAKAPAKHACSLLEWALGAHPDKASMALLLHFEILYHQARALLVLW